MELKGTEDQHRCTCGGDLRLVTADMHYHYTEDYHMGPDGAQVAEEGANWEDFGDDCGAEVETFLECRECHKRKEVGEPSPSITASDITVTLYSQEYGSEYFEYGTLEEAVLGIGGLTKRSLEQQEADGVEREITLSYSVR